MTEQPPATGGFIQFGDGPRIPVTDISWDKREPEAKTMPLEQFPNWYAGKPEPEAPRLALLSDFEVTVPIPPETASRIMRAIGYPDVADRIEIAAHPDLAELNLQVNGYYDEI